MKQEEKWNDFLSTGKVEDYLAYRNATEDDRTEHTFRNSSGDGEHKKSEDAEFSDGNGNGN